MLPNNITRRRVLQASATAAAAVRATAIGSSLISTTVQAAETVKVAKYVLRRLHQFKVETMFGVPGATWEGFFSEFSGTGVSLVINSSDLEAGYAADGYARMRGLGAVAVTRGVGILSMVNAIGGAYAERSPVVVINGGPSGPDLAGQRDLGVLYSHSIGRDKTDLNILREVTAYAERAETAAQVPAIVDKALTVALTRKRPVYIEINNAIWDSRIPAPIGDLNLATPPSGHEKQLAAQIIQRLKNASKPAILLGCEVQRYGLHDEVTALVTKLGIPYATTVLAKSAIPEQTSGFVGVYNASATAPIERAPLVQEVIRGADTLFVLGAVLSIGYRKLVKDSIAKIVRVGDGTVRIGRAAPVAADLRTLVSAMRQSPWTMPSNPPKLTGLSFDERRKPLPPVPAHPANSDLTFDEVMKSISDFLDASFVVMPDTSLSQNPPADVNVVGRNGYIANAVWQSIGYSVGAAIGVGAAQTQRRPLVICGDGGFQMNAQSLSTLAKFTYPDSGGKKLRAIVIVLDNALYAIEQQLVDPDFFSNPAASANPYLMLNRWDYNELARSMGFQSVNTVADPDSLTAALIEARNATGPTFITAKMNPKSLPAGLT
jgi:indolepyruvate decarboxylase